MRPIAFFAALLSCCFVLGATKPTDHAERIASLIDPAKLTTLKTRGAIPRIHKIVYQLELARRENRNIGRIIDEAMDSVSITSKSVRKLTKDSLIRNHSIATQLGCLNEAGMTEMRQGKAPTIGRGPYVGDELSVDHVIPLNVTPELDNVIANLELMPKRMNSAKQDKVGARQKDVAARFYEADLLSLKGYRAVMQAFESGTKKTKP